MKKLFFILLICSTAYAGRGPWGDDDPGNADPPNDKCAFCDDDEPGAPIDDIDPFLILGALALGFAITKTKKRSPRPVNPAEDWRQVLGCAALVDLMNEAADQGPDWMVKDDQFTSFIKRLHLDEDHVLSYLIDNHPEILRISNGFLIIH